MKFTDDRPIFLQIAEEVEDGILMGAFQEESQIPSITEISVNYKINPATALKGINILVDEGVVYKKRGVGMFVSKGAAGVLREKRTNQFYESYVRTMVSEAKRLGIPGEKIIEMIRRGIEDE